MVLFLLACAAPPPDPTWGQWIWSDADVAIFAESQRSIPNLVPTVWIGTVHGDGRVELGHSPRAMPNPAVLVRLDDLDWDRDDAVRVDEKIGRLLKMTEDAGVVPREVQLDYDCPVSKLPRYAEMLRRLQVRKPWITSLASHLADPDYGDRFRDVVAGHLVQVFDTGQDPTPEKLRADLDRAAMPFRLGLGAFERQDGGRIVTRHQAWFHEAALIRHSPWYRGSWVFPAGRSWTALREDG